MSTFAYARVSPKRTSGTAAASAAAAATNDAGVNAYVTAMAALVPSEVLAAHAAFLSFTTSPQLDEKKLPSAVTIISDGPTLQLAFYGLIAISIAIFVFSRYKEWDGKFDYIRLTIPPLAFVAWTMLQRTTAFDAAFPPSVDFTLGMRTGIAIFLAIILGMLAGWLQKQTNPA